MARPSSLALAVAVLAWQSSAVSCHAQRRQSSAVVPDGLHGPLNSPPSPRPHGNPTRDGRAGDPPTPRRKTMQVVAN
ncbi:hypothetical protein ACQJBY_073590 [Aegilops geniculata]